MGNKLTMSGSGDTSSDNKLCTSYEQNSEHNKKADGACEKKDDKKGVCNINTNVSDDENGMDDRGVGDTNTYVNDISDGIDMMAISDMMATKDDKLLFQDPPPNASFQCHSPKEYVELRHRICPVVGRSYVWVVLRHRMKK